MSGWEIGWGVYLAGLPFAPLLCHAMDLWHIQNLWADTGLAWLLALGLSLGSKALPKNLPLGLWIGWVSLSFGLTWFASMVTLQQYPLTLLMAYLHCLSVPVFYLAACWLWTAQTVTKLLRWLAWSSVPLLGLCVLQVFNLDPFFRPLPGMTHDPLVGMIGNPSHLAAHLVLLLPCYLAQGAWWWVAVLLSGGLVAVAGSLPAQVLFVTILLTWIIHQQPTWVLSVPIVLLLGALYVGFDPTVLRDHGRVAIWQQLWPYVMQQPIQGLGLGAMMGLSQSVKAFATWRHAHNEFYQVWLEQGWIGLGLIGAMLWAWWRKARGLWAQVEGRALLLMGVAFCGLACINFVAHLWVLASFGLLAYCGVYVLDRKELA